MMEKERAGGRAVLVGVERKQAGGSWTIQDSLEELARLADTAGLEVAATVSQKLAHPDASTFVGKGKVEELKELLVTREADYLVFDDELSPGQQRKLEKALGEGIRILDRTRLILDIFGLHARSREGKLQVELAQYQYLLPRLTGLRTGLEQQVGGSGAGPVGLRGPGETQLELDRRQVRRRIRGLTREIEEIRTQRDQHRKQRARSALPVVSLVGYTNAGKSSLLNALTGAGVLVEDKLFATLDPTTRRLRLPGGREALMTDTVGFIRKLPHGLVAAFRATLEGIREASLVLHVVDASHAKADEQISAVESVLTRLEAIHTPRLIVWNKADLLAAGTRPADHPSGALESVTVSAKTGSGLDSLLASAEMMLAETLVSLEAVIPYDRYELVTRIYEQGTVLEKADTEEGVRMRASVPLALAERLAAFRRQSPA
jgi:GTPase